MNRNMAIMIAVLTLVAGAVFGWLVVAKEATPEPPAVEAADVETLRVEDVSLGTGDEVRQGDTAVVHYTGWLYPNGRKFDSSVDRGQPLSFPVGAGRVIKGWDEGVVGMREGGKRVLIIPPDMAYGKSGYPPVIPPSATLRFEVELLEVR